MECLDVTRGCQMQKASEWWSFGTLRHEKLSAKFEPKKMAVEWFRKIMLTFSVDSAKCLPQLTPQASVDRKLGAWDDCWECQEGKWNYSHYCFQEISQKQAGKHLSSDLGQVHPAENAELLCSSSTSELRALWYLQKYCREDKTGMRVDTVYSTVQYRTVYFQ